MARSVAWRQHRSFLIATSVKRVSCPGIQTATKGRQRTLANSRKTAFGLPVPEHGRSSHGFHIVWVLAAGTMSVWFGASALKNAAPGSAWRLRYCVTGTVFTGSPSLRDLCDHLMKPAALHGACRDHPDGGIAGVDVKIRKVWSVGA